jgi:hypothetical protein
VIATREFLQRGDSNRLREKMSDLQLSGKYKLHEEAGVRLRVDAQNRAQSTELPVRAKLLADNERRLLLELGLVGSR